MSDLLTHHHQQPTVTQILMVHSTMTLNIAHRIISLTSTHTHPLLLPPPHSLPTLTSLPVNQTLYHNHSRIIFIHTIRHTLSMSSPPLHTTSISQSPPQSGMITIRTLHPHLLA